jgi:hypothetical protein
LFVVAVLLEGQYSAFKLLCSACLNSALNGTAHF